MWIVVVGELEVGTKLWMREGGAGGSVDRM